MCYYAEQSAKGILEIGCNEGYTTAALALNSPSQLVVGVDFSDSDILMESHQKHERPSQIGVVAKRFPNVIIIDQDSATIEYDKNWNVRFIFIDGGHHFNQVKIDTEKAIRHLSENTGGFIFWHDFGRNLPWIGVDQVLKSLRNNLDISLVDGTSLAFTEIRVIKA